MVKGQDAAAWQGHLAAVKLLDLLAQVEAVPKRHVHVVVLFDDAGPARIDQGGHFRHLGRGFRLVHPDLAHVVGQVVAHGPGGQVQLLVDQARGLGRGAALAHFLPQALEERQVPFEGGLGLAQGGGAHDDAQALVELEPGNRFLEALAFGLVLDLARHAPLFPARGQDEIAAGQGQIRGEEGAFVAGRFLDHLDEQFLIFFERFLDGGKFGPAVSGVDDLVVFGMDFVDLQKAVALGAVVDERRLQGRIDIVDAALVDIAPGLGLMDHFHIIFEKLPILGHGHFDLFAGEDANKHLLLALGASAHQEISLSRGRGPSGRNALLRR